MDFWQKEPALVIGLVTALIALLTSFGLTINQQQVAAITAFAGAVLAIVASIATRSQVSPAK